MRRIALGICWLLAVGCSKDSDSGSANGGSSGGGSGGSAAAGGSSGSSSGGSGASAGSDGGIACPTGVSKGPWVNRVDATSARIRWEGCSDGASPDVVLTPEPSGTPQTFSAEVAPFEITNRYTSLIPNSIPDDLPGTYYMHEVKLSGLARGCYSYQLTADPLRHGRFCTARPSGESFNFMAIADTNPGFSANTALVLEQLNRKGYDFTIHGGDIQYYASGLETWASWFPAMQPMLSQGAFFTAVGNHESEKPDEYEQYYLRFFGESGFEGTSAYYLFETGGVSFFSLDTESSLQDGADPAQYNWFAAKLAEQAAAPGHRFSVVFLHRPLITCGDSGVLTDERNLLEPLFEQYNVRLVIQGHMHGYERFVVPLPQGTRDLVYITTGGGGGAIGDVSENMDREFCGLRQSSGEFNHAMWLQVGATELKGQAIDHAGTAQDTFSIAVP